MTFVLFVELFLVFVTTLLLTQSVGKSRSDRNMGWIGAGSFLLMVTLGWSIVVGVLFGLGYLPELL